MSEPLRLRSRERSSSTQNRRRPAALLHPPPSAQIEERPTCRPCEARPRASAASPPGPAPSSCTRHRDAAARLVRRRGARRTARCTSRSCPRSSCGTRCTLACATRRRPPRGAPCSRSRPTRRRRSRCPSRATRTPRTSASRCPVADERRRRHLPRDGRAARAGGAGRCSRSSRALVLHHKSRLLRWMWTVFYAPGLLLGWLEEQQTLCTELTTHFAVPRGQPLALAQFSLSSCAVQVYDAALTLRLHPRGLGYLGARGSSRRRRWASARSTPSTPRRPLLRAPRALRRAGAGKPRLGRDGRAARDGARVRAGVRTGVGAGAARRAARGAVRGRLPLGRRARPVHGRRRRRDSGMPTPDTRGRAKAGRGEPGGVGSQCVQISSWFIFNAEPRDRPPSPRAAARRTARGGSSRSARRR